MMLAPSISNRIKGALIFSLSVIASLSSINGIAQRRPSRNGQKVYIGLEGILETQSFGMRSDIPALNNMPTLVEGGSFGIMFGNKVFHTRIKQGYYNSTSSVSEKLSLVESSGAINLYPLQLKKIKFRYLEPYFTIGIDHSILKLYGTYINQGSSAPPEGTYLGKINSLRVNSGLGLEYHIPGLRHFLNLFAGARYVIPVSKWTTDESFKNTKSTGTFALNSGVSLGFSR